MKSGKINCGAIKQSSFRMQPKTQKKGNTKWHFREIWGPPWSLADQISHFLVFAFVFLVQCFNKFNHTQKLHALPNSRGGPKQTVPWSLEMMHYHLIIHTQKHTPFEFKIKQAEYHNWGNFMNKFQYMIDISWAKCTHGCRWHNNSLRIWTYTINYQAPTFPKKY